MKKFIVLALAVIVGLCFSQPSRAAMDQGDKKFEVTGEVRFRGDYTDNATDLNSDGTPDDSGAVWPWRVRAAIHGQFSRNVSAHIEFQNFGAAGDFDSGIFNIQNSGSSSGNTQLYQGWLELGDIGGTSFDLRMGRQELVFGNEMLLGDLDFYNGINHDGLRGGWQYKKWTLDVFYMKEADPATFFTNDIFPANNGSSDIDLYGAYAVFKAPKKIGFDAYAILTNDHFEIPFGSGFNEQRTTIGGRVYSKWDSNWSYQAELALQSGQFDDGVTTTDISGAYGFEGELAYQWRKSKIHPRIYGRYASYSGNDDDSAESEAFSAPFQDFHARNGYFDLFRATNLNVAQVGVSWSSKEDRHVFGVDVLKFTSNQSTVGGVDVGEDDLGSELDLYYKYAYSKNVNITAAIASFQAGDLFDGISSTSDSSPDIAATADDGAMRVYVNTRLRF